MNKFIRVENTILITNNIEAVYPNYRIVKYGDEWCDEDEKAEDGVVVVMTNNLMCLHQSLQVSLWGY